MRKKLLLTVAAVGVLILAGCQKKYPSVDPLQGDFVADFSKGESEEVFASDGWSNGLPFNAVWKKENVTYADGKMHLSIKNETARDGDNEYPHTAGEARTHKLYGYGDFEVRMKPAKVVGTVSTFFTYTDEWNKVDGVENRHDEIDIEFLGKDTTKVQFNYFVDGKGGHEYMYNLGFDASKEFHNYGFRWEKDCITWLVDGKTAYQVKASAKNPLPEQSGRILMSYWPSSIEGWSGKFVGPTTETTQYEWVKSNAKTIYADGDEPQDPVNPDEGINWDEITATDVTLAPSSDTYTVTKSEGVSTVTYESAGNWACVSSADIVTAANANNVMSVNLKNNSSSTSTVRVDVQGTTKSGNTDCLNVSAAAEGHSEVYTDKEWGGSKIELAANEEVQFIIEYDVTTEARGAATNLLIFIDSLQADSVAHAGGSISISNVKFANTTGADITPYTPQPGPGPVPGPDTDEPDETWDPIDALDLSFAGSECYTIAKADGVTTVTYSEAGGYGCVFTDGIAETANQNDTVRVTLKNNSSSASKIRVDIQGTTKVGNSDCLNVKAEAAGHTDIYTDTTWGGSTITLAAGEKVHFIITYDTHTDKGAARNLLVFMDSLQGDMVAHEGGSISISSVKFAKLGEDPQPQPEEDIELTFSNETAYTLNPVNTATKSVNATYSNFKGNSYFNFGAGLAPEVVNGKGSFRVTVKNNGPEEVKVRIDIQGETQVGNTKDINVSASAQGHDEIYTDTTWGGSSLVVAADEEIEVTVVFDQSTERGAAQFLMFFIDTARGDENDYSGDVTLSKFNFDDATQPEDPEYCSLTFNASTDYTLTPAGEATSSVSVAYEGIVGNSYKNFSAGFGDITGKASFSLKIKNNGEASVRFRLDIKNGDTCLNTSASATGHTADIYTDLIYGGSFITVAAGEEVVFVVNFDQSEKAAEYLMFFVDSAQYDDSTTHSGSLTLSNFLFA